MSEGGSLINLGELSKPATVLGYARTRFLSGLWFLSMAIRLRLARGLTPSGSLLGFHQVDQDVVDAGEVAGAF